MFAPVLLFSSNFNEYMRVCVFTHFTPVQKMVEKHSHVQQGMQGMQGMQDANLENRPSNTPSAFTVPSPETVGAAPSGQRVECSAPSLSDLSGYSWHFKWLLAICLAVYVILHHGFLQTLGLIGLIQSCICRKHP